MGHSVNLHKGQTLKLIGPIHKLRRKWNVVNKTQEMFKYKNDLLAIITHDSPTSFAYVNAP